MRIEHDINLDYQDVLFKPKRSTLKSRRLVDLIRSIKFKNSKQNYSGIPIMAANMDGVGTFEMADKLKELNLFTCLRKGYTVNELVEFFDIVLGVTAFEFTLPGDSLASYDTCLVVCDDYSRTFTYNNYNGVTATFRKVYDASVGGVTFGDGANNVGVGVTPVGTSVAGGGGGGY